MIVSAILLLGSLTPGKRLRGREHRDVGEVEGIKMGGIIKIHLINLA